MFRFVRSGVSLFFCFQGPNLLVYFSPLFQRGSFGLSYVAQGLFIRVHVVLDERYE